MKHSRLNPIILLSALLITGCSEDTAPPSGAIQSPNHNSTVGGKVPVQVVARGDAEISKIQLYARNTATHEEGIFIGSTVSAPGSIEWNTGLFPSGATLDLYAKVTDVAGNVADTDPVSVTINNTDRVEMLHFMGIRVPPAKKTTVARQQWNPSEWRNVTAPSDLAEQPKGHIQKQADPVYDSNSEYYLDWVWKSYTPGGNKVLNGYRLKYSHNSLVGPYDRRVSILPQDTPEIDSVDKDKPLTPTEAAGTHYGVVVAVVGGAEIAMSNYTQFQFPGEQKLTSPQNGTVVAGGKPTLSWEAPIGADAYVFYVYNQKPDAPNVTPIWTVPTNDKGKLVAIKETSVTYPNSQTALPAGVYYWKVIGYDFNDEKVQVAATISPVWSFTVVP
ncbi:Ig-like domain-containing protein [Deinococcus cellulosilyticus]|uniref:Fibronectin type-III domain-containing protein n=1 Tax=Deinococcus cellulosilyticus (strain DSM 18568 / NBRC 106333 / KACC 11606 / 5516J-15) TaxID=1223518 RepID=A0A511N9G6_DEIC1|nr:Ig-like domain-containing protein [Deinococcus cellulosilyticus]GEM49475.1 hypothetical protein DC3_51100 [Deinococcus cellulosilyticus NBRC 106333 = KACC 11606]